MVKETRDYLELTYRSIRCFSDDGRLDPHELDRLVRIAMKDGVIDDNERRVLENIVAKLSPAELTPAMNAKIAEFRAKLKI